MNKLILLFAVLFLSGNFAVFADQPEQVISLKDGSQIKGVLAGIDNGVYTVKTPIIGDVHVNAADVASITTDGKPAALPTASASAPNLDEQLASAQQKLTSNPQSMAVIQQMAQDPDIAQALQDPDLVQAVTSHDYQAVMNNPKIQELMSNPKMQALLHQLAAQQKQQNSPSQ